MGIDVKQVRQEQRTKAFSDYCEQHGMLLVTGEDDILRLAQPSEGAVHGGGAYIDVLTGEVLYVQQPEPTQGWIDKAMEDITQDWHPECDGCVYCEQWEEPQPYGDGLAFETLSECRCPAKAEDWEACPVLVKRWNVALREGDDGEV